MTPSRNDIPIGRPGISRADLAAKWQKKDRTVRRIVQNMRMVEHEDGCVIRSTSHETGYWRTSDPVEIREFINETEARAKHTFIPLRVARLALSNVGQVRMEL